MSDIEPKDKRTIFLVLLFIWVYFSGARCANRGVEQNMHLVSSTPKGECILEDLSSNDDLDGEYDCDKCSFFVKRFARF